MSLLTNGKDLTILSLKRVSDLNTFYSSYSIVAPSVIQATKVTLNVKDNKQDLFIIDSSYQNGVYVYTAISQRTHKILNSTVNSFVGSATIKTLLNQKLGIPFASEYDSTATDWVFPRCRFLTVLKTITKYTKVGNGGGARFFIEFDGGLRMVDLKREFDLSNPKEINLVPDEDIMDVSWMNYSPGVVNITTANVDGIKTKKLIIKEGFGEGNIFINNTVDKTDSLMEQALINDFWSNYYQSRKITISNGAQMMMTIGSMFKIKGVDNKFMVSRIETDIPLNDAISNTTAYLVSCPEW